MDLTSTLTSLVGGCIGVGMLYIAVFLYDDEHGQIQNRLEHWWLNLQHYSEVSIGRHVIFAQRLSNTLGSYFDGLFGERMLSIRSAAVSSAYSFAALGAVLSLLMLYLFTVHFSDSAPAPVPYFPFPAAVTYPIAMLAAFAWCGLFTRLLFRCIDKPEHGQLTLIGTLLVAPIWFFINWCWYAVVAPPAPTFQLVVRTLITTSALACAVATDWLLLATTRLTLRACADFESFAMVLLSVAANVVLATVCVILPAQLFVGQYDVFGGLSVMANTMELAERLRQPVAFFAALSALNITALLPTLVFVIVSLTLLIHRILWRIASRPIYAVAEMGLAKRKKLCATVGSALLIPSVSGFSTWFKWLNQLI